MKAVGRAGGQTGGRGKRVAADSGDFGGKIIRGVLSFTVRSAKICFGNGFNGSPVADSEIFENQGTAIQTEGRTGPGRRRAPPFSG